MCTIQQSGIYRRGVSLWYNLFMNVKENMPSLQGRIKIITTESLYAHGYFRGLFKEYILRKKTGKFLRETDWQPNKIMFGSYTGYDLILKRLGGDNTYSLNINAADIGTSNTAPAASDTQLGAAVARAVNPTITQTSNVVSFQFFWPDANLTNGTYKEIGTFVDGSSSVNNGQIFNHALFATNYIKASLEDTTIQVDFTQTSSS